MAIPVNVVKHVISGTLAGGEVFQTSFWVKTAAAPAITDASETAFSTSSAMNALLNAIAGLMSSGGAVTGLDGYGYTGGGAATSHGHAVVNKVGAIASAHANQTCAVMTLRTAHGGRSGRGRMYLPATGETITAATGQFTPADINTAVDALAGLFTYVNTGGDSASVVSQTAAQAYPITSVDADYIPDIQRRRANKMRSLRHSHAV